MWCFIVVLHVMERSIVFKICTQYTLCFGANHGKLKGLFAILTSKTTKKVCTLNTLRVPDGRLIQLTLEGGVVGLGKEEWLREGGM